MRFTLAYDGELKADGDRRHKQEVRRAVHGQLKELWTGTPYPALRAPADALCNELDGWRFFPLASALRHEVVELDIIMLSPGDRGSLVCRGGDIDNRLKTLFDSLRMPQNAAELPERDHPQQGEDPFFCLMQDDALITSISVQTDRLLGPTTSPAQVKLLIGVEIRKVDRIGANMVARAG